MYRPNTQKQIQEKNINPNPKDSDQREKKTQSATTQADPGCGDLGVRAPGLGRRGLGRLGSRTAYGPHSLVRPRCARLGARVAWGDPGACGLGLVQPGATQAREPQATVAYSGLSHQLRSPISIFSPFLFLGFFVFFFPRFFSDVLVLPSLICSYL